MSQTASVTSVTICFDLFDLPTAQHKAGLAGLILQIGSMQERSRKAPDQVPPEEVPEIIGDVKPTQVTIRFTEASVKGLFDDLYAARVVEEQVVPICPFLRDHYPQGEEGAWHKLWRNMLWTIPRGNSQTRKPFELRAKGLPTKEGAAIWKDLLKVEKARARNTLHVTEVVGSLWLGAQAANAELVPFVGRAEYNLLLHFWPLTALVFVPRKVESDGTRKFVGYTLAIPEVAHLEKFCRRYRRLLGELNPAVFDSQPAAAIIDLPEQGALEFLDHLAQLAQQETAKINDFWDATSAVEFLHLAKLGHNIKLMAAGRVPARPELIDAYRAIVRERGYRNPLFRRGLMLALLREQAWYEPFASLLQQYAWPLFVPSQDSPNTFPPFWVDAALKFKALDQDYQHSLEVSMSNTDVAKPQPELALLIHQLIRTYIIRKVEDKTGLKWDKIKENKDENGKIVVPAEWNEAKEKVASDAFLQARSRREQAFVELFTGMFCSVKQYLPEEQYAIVAQALLTNPDNVKTLTLLALSANS